MRASTALCLGIAASFALLVQSCEPDQTTWGCKIYNGACACGYGCRVDFAYRNQRSCLNALTQRTSNACYGMPCRSGGICIQTAQSPGFSCKCDGTGFYGQRCEKACPTVLTRAMVFPHECIVI